jgi:hypothetical protein
MTSETIFIKMVLDAWHTHVKRTDELFNSLSDELLMKEVAPGRNRGVYLLGHLAAVHDRIFPLLELGNPLHAELWDPFVEKPDREANELPATQTLRHYWKEINETLASKMSRLSSEEWFQKHTSISAEDFAKEPHRNKLNIIVNRTNHLANHLGQLLLLMSKE